LLITKDVTQEDVMSQEKVDKRKYEKHHRKEIEKKRKARFAVKCIAVALVLGVVIGVPAGLSIYKSIPRYVGDATLETFVSQYIDDNYSEDIAGLGATTEAVETTEADN